MAISVTLVPSSEMPNHGDTLTVTYVVQGNSSGPGTPVTLSGEITVGTTQYPITASLQLPGTPALAETFEVPTCPGLTFQATANPAVFTAVVP